MKTFEFKNAKTCNKVWETLNETAINFCSYHKNCITVFSSKDYYMVRNALDDANIKYEVIQ